MNKVKKVTCRPLIEGTYTFKIIYECLSIRDKKNQNVFDLELHDVEYCCGILEMGNITCDSRAIKNEYFNKILDLSIIQLIQDNTNKTKCITLMANLNGNVACIILRNSFLRTKLFTLVKTFSNSNSNHIIEIWISNN